MSHSPSPHHTHSSSCGSGKPSLAAELQDSFLTLDRRKFLTRAAALSALPTLCGCFATNPVTGQRAFVGSMDTQAEIQFGRENHEAAKAQFGGTYDNPRVQRYVNEMGQELARNAERQDLTYTFTVLNTDLMNAFAMPGGYVYITRGILAMSDNEAELAGVIGHEIGHVAALHSAQRFGRQQALGIGTVLGSIAAGVLGGGELARTVAETGQSLGGMMLAGWGRDQELEADRLSVNYLSRSGFDPRGMVSFLSKLRQDSQLQAKIAGRDPRIVDQTHAMATHPRTIDRVQQAIGPAEAAVGANPRVGKDRHLDMIDGMIFGSDPKEGVVYGRTFKHPTLRVAFTAPEEAPIKNQPDAVYVILGKDGQVRFDAPSKKKVKTLDQALVATFDNKRPRDAERIRINGMPAITGSGRGNSKIGPIDQRVVIADGGDRFFRFIIFTRQAATQSYARDLRRMTYSLRRLSRREASAIRPKILKVVRARRGQTGRSFAQRLPYEEFKVERWEVLNGMPAGIVLRAGERIKTVSS
ncbi:MAG: M48 family metalloprotease [Pseudomonadota bacterium]